MSQAKPLFGTMLNGGCRVMTKFALRVTEQVTVQATEQAEALLSFCDNPRSTKEMMQYLKLSHRPHFRNALLLPLIASGKLLPTIPDKPSSPKQRYVAAKQEVNKSHFNG